jgi:hypothetical protein
MTSHQIYTVYHFCSNIAPGYSTIPHAGRGAFAVRLIRKGGLVAPAPLVHFADKTTLNMYNETRTKRGKLVKNQNELLTQQMIVNYMFGHPNSSVVLFPYSANVAYINHHATKFNAKLQWASNFSFHNEDWLYKDVKFLEQQWRAGRTKQCSNTTNDKHLTSMLTLLNRSNARIYCNSRHPARRRGTD